MYRREKLLFALLVVFGLSALLGGCVGMREKFLGVAERAPGLDPDPGLPREPRVGEVSSPLLGCGLREVSPKEAGIDLEALWKDSQIAALRERLERRGLKPILGALRLFASPSVKLGLLPFGTEAGIAFEERAGQRTAVALVKQANGTLNIAPDGHEELWTLLSSAEVESIVADLKRDQAFATFEKNLASQGWRLQLAQSVGVQTTDKGLLYLAAVKDLSARPSIEYYRIQVSRSGGGSRMVAGTQRALCAQGDAQVLGMPVGAVMSPVGAYGAELQAMPTDPCVLGLSTLACLDIKRWLAKLEVEARKQTLAAQNIAAQQQDRYVITHVRDPRRALDLLLAGFDQLTESEIEQWLNVASALSSTQMSADPRLQEAWRLLRSSDPTSLVKWLQKLAEAQQQGNFDEVYNQLLSQGMDQLQQAYMLLLYTKNPAIVKELIKQMALMVDPLVGIDQQQSAGIEFIKSLIIWLLTEAQPTLPGFPGMSETEARAIAEHFAASLQAALNALDPLLPELCSMGLRLWHPWYRS